MRPLQNFRTLLSSKRLWPLAAYGMYLFLTYWLVRSVSIPFATEPHSKWTIAGVLGSIILGLTSYGQLCFTSGGKEILEELGKWAFALVFPIVFWVLPGCAIFSLMTLFGFDYMGVRISRDICLHVGSILVAAILVSIIDVCVFARIKGNIIEKARFKKLVLYADAPVVFGFTVLLIWLLDSREVMRHYLPTYLEIFVGGSVAFQLISSNLIFAFIQTNIDLVRQACRTFSN